jgi:transcriptional regulator of arginine metabolism
MKAARHAMILELIEKYEIETQEELGSYLKEHNYAVTQATVSRDIKELRLIKALTESGKYKYATVDKTEAGLKDRFTRIFSQSVVSVTSAGNIIVIKTINGTANAAGEAIDFLKWSEIAGTLAGDNTIFVAVKDAKVIPDLMKRFHSMMKN